MVENHDWVAVTDELRGPEALFHKNRERIARMLVAKYALPGERILDAGRGTGLNLRHLPAGSVGLDINPRNIAAVRARIPGRAAVLGDVGAMPLHDDSC